MADWIGFGRQLIAVIRADNISFLAAAIAFYAVMSIFPLVLLAVVIGSWFGGEAFASLVVTVVEDFLTPQTESLVQETIVDGPGRSGAGLVGFLVLGWSGLKVFRALAVAFSVVHADGGATGFLETVLQAFIVLLAMGCGFFVMFVVNSIVHVFVPAGVLPRLTPIVVFLLLVMLFFPVYLIFPTERPPLRAVIPGAVIAAGGWTILGELFGIYAANATTFALFGVIGGFLLLLTWFYFGAMVLLVGAEVNALLQRRSGDPATQSADYSQGGAEERTLGDELYSQGERDE